MQEVVGSHCCAETERNTLNAESVLDSVICRYCKGELN